jgi:hypothetical protein
MRGLVVQRDVEGGAIGAQKNNGLIIQIKGHGIVWAKNRGVKAGFGRRGGELGGEDGAGEEEQKEHGGLIGGERDVGEWQVTDHEKSLISK